MGQIISKQTIEDIRQRSDIVDVIGARVPLKRSGTTFKGLCPFHSEKTPSFHVNPQRQIFHCFGCGAGGDVFSFLMKSEGVTFSTAVRMLAEKAGIPIELSEGEDPDRDEKEVLLRIHEDAAAAYHQLLLKDAEAEAARAYLARRDFSAETIASFQFGYAPERRGAAALLKGGKYTLEQLEKAGLMARSGEQAGQPGRPYDRFRRRLMIPIRDELGRVIAFTGRVLDKTQKGGKYVNSPETRIFHKSRVLFNLDRARKAILDARMAIICEGQIDVIRCVQAGIGHVVASQGTAFTEDHARILRRYTDTAVIAFDSDKAGQDAALKTAQLFLRGELVTQIAALPDGEDPDSLIQKQGPDAFLKQIGSALSLLAFQHRMMSRREDASKEVGRMRISRALLETVNMATSAMQRESMIREAAKLLNVPEAAVRNDLKQRRPAVQGPETPAAPKAAQYPREELELLELVLAHPEAGKLLQVYLPPAHLQSPVCRRLLEHILARPAGGEWNLMDELAGDEESCRVAASLQFNLRTLEQPDMTAETAAKALILVITRKKLERIREALRRKAAENPSPALEKRRMEITHDISLLRRDWEHAEPVLEVYADADEPSA